MFCSLTSLVIAAAVSSDPALPPVPIAGTLVLSGAGTLPECVRDAAVGLAPPNLTGVDVVVVGGSTDTSEEWLADGAGSVTPIDPGEAWTDEATLAMLRAEVLWFAAPAEELWSSELFLALTENLRGRGGVLGSEGEATEWLVAEAGVLPSSRVHLVRRSARTAAARKALERLVAPGDGLVAWQIPTSSALIVHGGRRVGVVGERPGLAFVPSSGDWPERRTQVDHQDVFDPGDVPPYGADLLSWIRSARDRAGPVFPSAEPPTPEVPAGTLVISGGGGVQSPTWRRFIEGAGGADATIVCIPSAGGGARPDSYSADQLRDHGCTDVHVLHAPSVAAADGDPRLLALLERATGVWIDGGRTYRVMDRYENTRAHGLMRAVLEKGGAVGGSSAGAQVAGDFLLRGDPRTNRALVFEGYTRGLGFLPGVIIDAHFRDRGREGEFAALMREHPKRLGIGIDGDTALVVEGTEATVLGGGGVSFYDLTGTEAEPVVLEEGGRYDLGRRAALR